MRIQDSLITVATLTLKPLVEFYAALLGCPPQLHWPSRYAEFPLPGGRLGLFVPRQQDRGEFSGTRGGMSLCLEVADLEDAIATLTRLHCPPSEIIIASHGREAYAYDPDGNRLILHERTAISEDSKE